MLKLQEKLKSLISTSNEKYQKYNDRLAGAVSETETKTALAEKQAFIHCYADQLHTFLYENLLELTAKDCTLLDTVPYLVWNQMTDKSNYIVEAIKQKG